MLQRTAIVALAILVTACGSTKGSRDISGQIFIVTKAASNVKLGAIEVVFTTNSEGAFSVQLPAEKAKDLFAIAYATRLVVDETEKYSWIVPVPSDGKLILDNHNLLTAFPDHI